MKFFDVINFQKGDVIALTGGGGKTSTMYAIGTEAACHGLKTVLTTTTKIYYPEDPRYQVVTTSNPLDLFHEVRYNLTTHPLIIVGSGCTKDNKLIGLEPSNINCLFEAGADLIIIEADGSARKPLKAPAEHEPVIPPITTMVIPLVGIDCLGQPLTDHYVHRAEIASQLCETPLNEVITTETVAKLLIHPEGGRKNLPSTAQWIPFINKIQSINELILAREIALTTTRTIPCKVLLGAAQNPDPVLEVRVSVNSSIVGTVKK